MSNRFYYAAGINQSATQLSGKEHCLLGCRPYGYHAGNMLAGIVYPYLLCEAMRLRGVEPSFAFEVTFNDMELVDPGFTEQFPHFITRWGSSTFELTADEMGCCSSTAVHWGRVIKKHFARLTTDFPAVTLNFTPTSEMMQDARFRAALLDCIRQADRVQEIVYQTCKDAIPPQGTRFAGLLCASCKTNNTVTHAGPGLESVWAECQTCGAITNEGADASAFWSHWGPIRVAKGAMFDPDVWFTGGDYIADDEYTVYELLGDLCNVPSLRRGIHIFSPVLLGANDRPMKKSGGNSFTASFEYLRETARNSNESRIVVPIEDRRALESSAAR